MRKLLLILVGVVVGIGAIADLRLLGAGAAFSAAGFQTCGFAALVIGIALLALHHASALERIEKNQEIGSTPRSDRPFGGSDRPEGVVMSLDRRLKNLLQQKAAADFAALKSRLLPLALTEAQALMLSGLFESKFQKTAKALDRLSGETCAKETELMPAWDRELRLKQLLTPEQWTAYQQYRAEERRAEAQMLAAIELMEIQSALQLDPHQRELVSKVLGQLYERAAGRNGSVAIIVGGPDFNSNPEGLEMKRRALWPVLTDEQLKRYEAYLGLSSMPAVQRAVTPVSVVQA